MSGNWTVHRTNQNVHGALGTNVEPTNERTVLEAVFQFFGGLVLILSFMLDQSKGRTYHIGHHEIGAAAAAKKKSQEILVRRWNEEKSSIL